MGRPPPLSKYPKCPQNTKNKTHEKVLTNRINSGIMYTYHEQGGNEL